jgi:hypothetical protein
MPVNQKIAGIQRESLSNIKGPLDKMSRLSENLMLSLGKKLTRYPSRQMPRRTTMTLLYNLANDCVLAVSPEKRAMQLVRQYLALHKTGLYLTITIKNSDLVGDWLVHGVVADYLEIEDPRCHTEYPTIVFCRKDDRAAMQSITASYPAMMIIEQLLDNCHLMADLEEHKELNALYLNSIQDMYATDNTLQELISRQQEYNESVIDAEYERLRKACIVIDQSDRNIYEEISSLQHIKIGRSFH